MLGEAMSIFARSTCAPSACLPSRISRKRARFSAGVRPRKGESLPGSLKLPRLRCISCPTASPRTPRRADERLGELVHQVEVVAREVEVLVLRPEIEAQPAHHLDDRLDVLHLLLLGVGVVEAHVADAAVLLGEAEVQADRLGVADVQVAVGLRREARADLRRVQGRVLVHLQLARMPAPLAPGVLARGEVGFDALLDEVGDVGALGRAFRVVRHCERVDSGRRKGLFWPILPPAV